MAKTSIALRLPYPPSVNNYWKHFRGRVVIGAKGAAYRKDVQAAVLAGDYHNTALGRLAVSVECIMPDRRKRDIDNILKAVLDSLEHAGVFDDDEQIDKLVVRRLHVEPPGAVDVIIEEL